MWVDIRKACVKAEQMRERGRERERQRQRKRDRERGNNITVQMVISAMKQNKADNGTK